MAKEPIQSTDSEQPIKRTLLQELLFAHHHHHDDSAHVEGGLIYYNETDLLVICKEMQKSLEEHEEVAVDKETFWNNIKISGKKELLQEMISFFEHKV